MVVFDTSIIIDHLRQKSQKSQLIRIFKTFPEEKFGLSVVTIAELYEGSSTRDEEAEKTLLATLAILEILPFTYETAKLSGTIVRDLTKPIELPDAAIAATAILSGAKLATLDKKDFLGIDRLELLSWKQKQ